MVDDAMCESASCCSRGVGVASEKGEEPRCDGGEWSSRERAWRITNSELSDLYTV